MHGIFSFSLSLSLSPFPSLFMSDSIFQANAQKKNFFKLLNRFSHADNDIKKTNVVMTCSLRGCRGPSTRGTDKAGLGRHGARKPLESTPEGLPVERNLTASWRLKQVSKFYCRDVEEVVKITLTFEDQLL